MSKPMGRPRRVLSDLELKLFHQLAAEGHVIGRIAVALEIAERTAKRLAAEHHIAVRQRKLGPGQMFTQAQIAEIQQRLARGESDRTIAHAMGCGHTVIFQTRRRRGWARGEAVTAHRRKAALVNAALLWAVPEGVKHEVAHE
jgi:hypothetical protein